MRAPSAGLALHLLSDFNVHIDSVCSNVMILHNFDNFGLVQHANFSTHSRGHTLDQICSSGIINVSGSGSQTGISDHILIKVRFDFPFPEPPYKTIIN